MNNHLVYLDSAATSKPEKEVLHDINLYNTMNWYNPSAIYEPAKQVRRLVELSRGKVRSFINANIKDKIIFGSNASEMITLALNGHNYNSCDYDSCNYEIFSTRVEHSSIKNQEFIYLIKSMTKKGLQDIIDFTKRHYIIPIVCLSYVNGEIGIINQVKEISKIIHEYNGLILLDCCQAVGHISIDVKDLDVDFAVFTSEKFCGVRGCGVLYVKYGIDYKIKPMIYGGMQEDGIRPGTENTSMIIAMGNQLERIQDNLNERMGKETILSYRLLSEIYKATENICKIKINGENEKRIPNILSVQFKGIDNQQLLTMLNLNGIACSASSACNAGKKEPSSVLLAYGLTEKEALNTIRFSFDYRLQESEIIEFGNVLTRCLKMLKGVEND